MNKTMSNNRTVIQPARQNNSVINSQNRSDEQRLTELKLKAKNIAAERAEEQRAIGSMLGCDKLFMFFCGTSIKFGVDNTE